ncbi:hypothetical protein E5357_07610 [Hominisplanchenecus murintestinalis]|uniref:Uncharacterized protein n=1 Tax=Hominisplanchenecus murintestinalis TaxID=2941517 RepID=A0AC61QZY2_9FIRM|nr:hypothetical protein [Hominisplanchenecus murintestinalis]TGX98821.1 hypothetical protein E5357_07610 [Hominisplanchenecus murintestinalis]
MKIKFFEKNGVIDEKAIMAGVYQFKIGLVGDEEDNYLLLYIGESYSMIQRCGFHLYNIFQNPTYFGLSHKHLTNDKLQLIVEIYESISFEKEISNEERDKILRDKEREVIIEKQPLSQCSANDDLRENRVEIVGSAIEQLLNKQ